MRNILLLILSLSILNAETIRVYLGTGEKGIYTTFLDTATGALTEATLLAEIKGSGFLKLGDGVLYSTCSTFKEKGGVAAFSIGDNGSLSLLNEVPTGGKGVCHVSLDATGKVLLFANYSGGSSGAYILKEDGSISERGSLCEHEGSSVHEKRQTGPRPHSIYTGPENKFAYVPDLGTDEIWTYALDKESAGLTLVNKAEHPAGGGPRHMKFGKDGKQAYVLSELTLHTVIYDRDPETGHLAMRESVSNLEGDKNKERMTCSEIRVSADGRFLYVANRDLDNKKRDSLSVFSVEKEGSIKLIQEIPAEVWVPRNINLSPDGKWLLVAGQKSHEVSSFSVDKETGKLAYTGNKISVPSPLCVEFLYSEEEEEAHQ